MLEEGICARVPRRRNKVMVCCIKRWQGKVDYITPRGVYSSWWWCTRGSWRAEMMTRITDCSAGLGCFEDWVGMSGHEQDRQLTVMLVFHGSWHCGEREDSFHR